MEEDPIFPEHLSESSLIPLIKTGQLFMGKLFISSNNVYEGKINVENLGFQVRIVGEKRLNRAMNGDIVAVRLLMEEEWVNETVLDLEEQ
jgi:exosome complex exonuclease DIS3/RRP44